MPKTLVIELRNKNFGPVKEGAFFAVQIAGTKGFGIGDGLFVPPRGYSTAGQLGFEGLIQATVTIVYKDGKTQTLETPLNSPDAKTLHIPGKFDTINIDLLEDKNYQDIQIVNLCFKTPKFGHSRSGGGGLTTHLQKTEIGSAAINGNKINFDGKIVAAISLSDRWDPTTPVEELSTHQDEAIHIEFLTRKKDIEDTAWQNIELVDNWRSALAPHWYNYQSRKDKQNNSYIDKWTIPIKIFEPGKEGWVIGINDGSQITASMKEHALAFAKYCSTEGYKAEEKAYLDDYFGKNTANNEIANPSSKVSRP